MPILREAPPEPRPPWPRLCCPPGTQKHMTGSDDHAHTRWGCEAIFDNSRVGDPDGGLAGLIGRPSVS